MMSSSPSSKKRRRSKNSEKSSLSRKRRRTIVRVANAIANRTRANAMLVAIAAYANPEIFPILRKRRREAVVRRDRKLHNGNHFRDWTIDPNDVLANPQKYGLKFLEQVADLGSKMRKCKGNVNNRVYRFVTCGHSDYEDGGIVYAIVVKERGTHVNRVMWVCSYGMRILREYDRRIYAKKLPKDKTAYAMVDIRIGGERKEVLVHALLFNKKYGRGSFHETDHIDNSDEATNGLNNLLVNVRDGAPDGTNRVNSSHRSTFKNNTSGHTGVSDVKGSNEGGRKENGDFGCWQVNYNKFNKDTKETKMTSKLFSRDYGDEAHKREMFKEACEFQERMKREYVDDLEEYVEPIRVRQSHWFAMRELKEVFELARTSK